MSTIDNSQNWQWTVTWELTVFIIFPLALEKTSMILRTDGLFFKGYGLTGVIKYTHIGWMKQKSKTDGQFSYVIYPVFSDMVWVGSHIMTPDCCPRNLQELCHERRPWKAPEYLIGSWWKGTICWPLVLLLLFYFKGSRGWKDLKREVSPRDWIVLVKWHTYLREPSWKLMHFSCVDRTFQSQVAASKSVWSVAVTETIALCLIGV